MLKVICYEVIEFSVSCDVISSLLPGLTPGLFYVPAALAKRSLGVPLSRAATTIPQRQRSGRRGAGKAGAIAPVQAAAWWGCHQVLDDKPGPLADRGGWVGGGDRPQAGRHEKAACPPAQRWPRGQAEGRGSAHEPPQDGAVAESLLQREVQTRQGVLRSKRPRVRRLSDLTRSAVPKVLVVPKVLLTHALTPEFCKLYRVCKTTNNAFATILPPSVSSISLDGFELQSSEP